MIPLPAAALAAALNHLLHQSPWAAERLKPHAGKRVRFALPLALLTLKVLDGGLLEAADDGREADVRITLTPGLMLRLGAGDEAARAEVPAEGDAALAQEVLFLVRNLRWDAEDDLARLFGDLAAHRMAEGARRLAHWQRQSAQELAAMTGEYLTEEKALLPGRAEVEQFVREVDRLRDDAARLEKRVERLSRGG